MCDSSVLFPVGHEVFSCGQSAFKGIMESEGRGRNTVLNSGFSFAAAPKYSLTSPYGSSAAVKDYIHRYYVHFGRQNGELLCTKAHYNL